MLETSLHISIGVNSSTGRIRRKPGDIDIQIHDHGLGAYRSNTSYPCGNLGVPCWTAPQVDVHRSNGIAPIPNLARRIDEFGVWPVGVAVSDAILRIPGISEPAGKGLCRCSHFR
jgi:hypothetical protein